LGRVLESLALEMESRLQLRISTLPGFHELYSKVAYLLLLGGSDISSAIKPSSWYHKPLFWKEPKFLVHRSSIITHIHETFKVCPHQPAPLLIALTYLRLPVFCTRGLFRACQDLPIINFTSSNSHPIDE
jgi:hypothetical protein